MPSDMSPDRLMSFPPRVWAWRAYRGKIISRLFDSVYVLFPFETGYFENARWFGHPLAELAKPEIPAEEFLDHYGLESYIPRVLLLPGSRPREIERLTGVSSGYRTPDSGEDGTGGFPVSPRFESQGGDPRLFLDEFPRFLIPVDPRHKYAAMAACDVAIGASGTAALECGLMKTLMCVLYRLGALSTLFGMMFVRTDHISLPNIVLDEPVMRELINEDCNAEEIARWVNCMISDNGARERIRTKLSRLELLLKGEGRQSKRSHGRLSEANRDHAADDPFFPTLRIQDPGFPFSFS
ncbi:MAG: hypothetical protein MZV49_13305 [Rhodopseudomonas palustris]|nr:hypothetical protein [Rhodopseudomonas palustris]